MDKQISKLIYKSIQQELHKRAYLSGNGGLGKRNQENELKAEKDKTESATELGKRTKKRESSAYLRRRRRTTATTTTTTTTT